MAVPEDASEIVNLMVSFYRSVKRTINIPKLSLKKILALVDKSIVQNLAIVAVEDGKPVGIMILSHSPTWFSEENVLQDLCTFVDAPYRNSTHGRDLLKAARDYAILSKVPLILSMFTGEDLGRKCKLYQRLGFRPLGGTFGVNL